MLILQPSESARSWMSVTVSLLSAGPWRAKAPVREAASMSSRIRSTPGACRNTASTPASRARTEKSVAMRCRTSEVDEPFRRAARAPVASFRKITVQPRREWFWRTARKAKTLLYIVGSVDLIIDLFCRVLWNLNVPRTTCCRVLCFGFLFWFVLI